MLFRSMDQGIHMLDLISYLLEERLRCEHAIISTRHWDIEYEDNVMLSLISSSGVMVSVHSSATQWDHKFALEIYGATGSLKLQGLVTPSMSYAPEQLTFSLSPFEDRHANWGHPSRNTMTFDIDDSWEKELDEFVCAINKSIKIKHGTFEQALDVMRLIDEAYSFRGSIG